MDSKKDMSPIDSKNSIILHKKSGISVFLNKKSEKIAAAVYLLTDLIGPSDPLRTELRSCALELLSATLSAEDAGKDSMLRHARKLLSLLQVASYARLVSEMNCSIFRREIETLIGHIETRFSRAGEAALSSIFFQIDNLGHDSDHHPRQQEVSYKGHENKGQIDVSFKKQIPRKPKQEDSLDNSNVNEKRKRHEEIIRFFRTVKKSDVSIKDISDVIKDCSEKTIQRELIESVQKGILRKDGERRWSRYSLVG